MLCTRHQLGPLYISILCVQCLIRRSLHVSISDTAKQQFTLPAVYFPRPTSDETSQDRSDLVFNYDTSPFAFWITRTSSSDILFDTRTSSLPRVPTTSLDGLPLDNFGLVFEDQYLQVCSAGLVDRSDAQHRVYL